MYSVTFSQFLHASQKAETFSATYTTYTEVTNAVIRYFDERKGRYPNEVIVQSEAARTSYTLPDLPLLLLKQESAVEAGIVYKIHLELDGTTKWGAPILQTVEISMPDRVQARLQFLTDERRQMRGDRICYCGDFWCDEDCGTLECGCIDRCKGRCGLRNKRTE